MNGKEKIFPEKTTKEMYEEMDSSIKNYYQERKNQIEKNKNFKYKHTLIPTLQTLVRQANLLLDPNHRIKKIEAIYKWYKAKEKFTEDLKIDKRTGKSFYEELKETTIIPSEIYQAKNYKTEFEPEHRTEGEGIIPPKIRLKEYKTKKINSGRMYEKTLYNQLDKNKEKSNDHQKVLSKDKSISSLNSTALFKSTMNTTTKEGSTGFKFNKTETEIKREIRSSYAYFKPNPYDTKVLDNEKKWLIDKNRELAEKINQEEMINYKDEWAMERSKLNEEIERKKELKKLILGYEKNNLPPKGEKEKELNPLIKEGIIEEERLFTANKLKRNDKSVLQNNESSAIVQTLSTGNFNTESSVENKNFIIKSPRNNKKEKIIFNNDVKVSKIVKSTQKLNPKKQLIKLEKFDSIPLEVTSNLLNNRAFTTRNLYNNPLNYKNNQVDLYKDGYHYNPISVYETLNEDEKYFGDFNKFSSVKRPITSYFQNECNLFNNKKKLSHLGLIEIKNLKNDLAFAEMNISLKTLKKAFLTPSEKSYPKYFLPTPGYGLPKNPITILNKKKRPTSKKN